MYRFRWLCYGYHELQTYIGYNSSQVIQSVSVSNSIYSIYTLAQGVGCILCGVVLLFIYPLGIKQVMINTEKLNKRREVENEK